MTNIRGTLSLVTIGIIVVALAGATLAALRKPMKNGPDGRRCLP
jgi:hypothetical protein